MQASSHKTGSLSKAKCVGRRSAQESQWLDDLFHWTVSANHVGTDPLFSRLSIRPPGSRKFLTGKMVRTAVKDAVKSVGLPPMFFSGHSLRKAMYIHMSAAGCTADDKRDRGNYANGSTVGDRVYDYAGAGHGPLSSNLLEGGFKPNIESCKSFSVLSIQCKVGDLPAWSHIGGGGRCTYSDLVSSRRETCKRKYFEQRAT